MNTTDAGDVDDGVVEAPEGRLLARVQREREREARILRLLIERIHVAPDGISVALHAAGICSLVAELADQKAPAPAASEPLLEAAE